MSLAEGVVDAVAKAPSFVHLTYREAVRAALRDALSRDDRVLLMGEDVGMYGGTYACSRGLLEEFGPERVRDTPLSEAGVVCAGVGAAIAGMRPIVEIRDYAEIRTLDTCTSYLASKLAR